MLYRQEAFETLTQTVWDDDNRVRSAILEIDARAVYPILDTWE